MGCLLMDALGYATYVLPVVGELGDIVFAPISGYLFYRFFGGKIGRIGGVLNFLEEASPGLDFIPTFTLAWCVTYLRKVNHPK